MIAAGNESAEAAGNSTYGGGLLFPPYVRAAYILLCVVILGIGVVGNVMVPLVIVKTKDMRNSTNIFLINLSVADLMVLLVCTPTVLVEVNSEPLIWVLGEEIAWPIRAPPNVYKEANGDINRVRPERGPFRQKCRHRDGTIPK
ncbi:unnamed protein product [Nezara viridula]|uniref:G-protein coupled receptors family 1 profile domain-containing protein n=1 Tax=Nezara viridula TaxID=85310 RepID=A0A9P0H7Y8_NEZVI|nr:unnamed protein product [Nezara viridula]